MAENKCWPVETIGTGKDPILRLNVSQNHCQCRLDGARLHLCDLAPIHNRPTWSIAADFEHFAAFVVLGGCLCLAYPQRIELVCAIVAGSPVLLELMQVLTPDRHGAIHDAIEKIAGAAGIFTSAMIRWSNKLLRRFQDQP
jgi:hypothetical protein